MTSGLTLQPSRGAIVIAVVLSAVLFPIYCYTVASSFQADYTAFWCAGSAILQRQNPYLDGSLHPCEVAHGILTIATVPVPYPPYVMWMFALLALVPEKISFGIWCVISATSSAFTAIGLRRLTALSWPLVVSATAASLLIPTLFNAQPVPLAVCGLTWSLVFLEENAGVATACLGAVTIFPSFALAAWAGASTRRSLWLGLSGCTLVLLIASIAAVGTSGTEMYVRQVLPAHGLSEITLYWQLGLEAILHAWGVPIANVTALALVLYVAVVLLGIASGLRLSQRYGGAYWPVASACAFATLGSPFVHGWDAAFALPFCLLLLTVARTPWAALCSVIFIVPWEHLAEHGGILAAVAIPPILVIFDALTSGRLAMAVAATAAVSLGSLFICTSSRAADEQGRAFAALPHPSPRPGALADERWSQYARARTTTAGDWYRKIPHYAALLLLLSGAVARAAANNKNPNAA